jgi:hypothetical protein
MPRKRQNLGQGSKQSGRHHAGEVSILAARPQKYDRCTQQEKWQQAKVSPFQVAQLVSGVVENGVAHIVVGNRAIEWRKIGIAFARQVQRQAEGNPSQGRVDWIERVGVPVEQLDSGCHVTRFIERLRGQWKQSGRSRSGPAAQREGRATLICWDHGDIRLLLDSRIGKRVFRKIGQSSGGWRGEHSRMFECSGTDTKFRFRTSGSPRSGGRSANFIPFSVASVVAMAERM